MRVIIAGSRRYDDYAELVAGIEASGFDVTEVVSGGAKGADALGEQWARERGIPIQRFDADWDRFGKGAGHVRNGKMAAYAEALIAFPLSDSPGTADMIKQATGVGLLVHVHRFHHRCHANGCQVDDCHRELPFCRRHFGMLPEWLRKAVWNGRRLNGRCGACVPDPPLSGDEALFNELGLPSDAKHRAAPEWFGHFNLAVAIALTAEYGDCGAPPELYDDEGFCWGCGVDQADETYRMARAELTKHTV